MNTERMATAAETLDEVESGARRVPAKINYLLPGTPINRRFVSAGVEVNTGKYAPFDVTIRDGRSIRDHFTLDRHGFLCADAPTRVEDFYDFDGVDGVYPAEVAEHVKRLTGASSVAAINWMIRTSGDVAAKQRMRQGPYVHARGVQPPAGEAHIDTEPSRADRQAEEVYRKLRPDGAGYKRYIYGSFWRTFSPPPQDCPLALCDNRSVPDDDGVPNVLQVVDKIPDGEAMFAPMDDESKPAAAIFHFNPNHRWWYFSNMQRDEALLFKFHDSDRSVAWRVPHTAFWDPSFPDANIRESIEARIYAFFE
jgi:hypothetical protein